MSYIRATSKTRYVKRENPGHYVYPSVNGDVDEFGCDDHTFVECVGRRMPDDTELRAQFKLWVLKKLSNKLDVELEDRWKEDNVFENEEYDYERERPD